MANIVNVWNCKAQGAFVAEIVQRNVFSCCTRIQDFDFAKGVADAPDCRHPTSIIDHLDVARGWQWSKKR